VLLFVVGGNGVEALEALEEALEEALWALWVLLGGGATSLPMLDPMLPQPASHGYRLQYITAATMQASSKSSWSPYPQAHGDPGRVWLKGQAEAL
jgi:hypothetical protein